MKTTVMDAAAAMIPATARTGRADRDRHDDREQQRRERVDRVGDDDERAVDPAAEVAGDETQQDADEHRHRDRDDHDHERGLRTPDDAGEHVVAADRRAEQVRRARRLLRAEVAVGSVSCA
jgi:hypothetical protein